VDGLFVVDGGEDVVGKIVVVGRKGIVGFGRQLNGTKLGGSKGPMAVRGTTSPLERSHLVRSVPGWRPILTPSSVTGIKVTGDPDAFAMV